MLPSTMQDAQAIPAGGALPPVLALVPHQDDELLIMGPAVRRATRLGRSVRLVLLGLGDGTFVRTEIMPGLLGREPTGEEIGQVRDAEFRDSGRLLGVEPGQIRTAGPRQREKDFSPDICRQVLLEELAALPGAELWVTSEHDDNPDHAALGLAARHLAASGDLAHTQVQAFVAPWCRGGFPHPPLRPLRAPLGYREQRPYRFTDVEAGRWGVGYKSVRRHFNAQLNDPVCYSYDLRDSLTTDR